MAFAHWPETAQFQPMDVDELRSYIQLRAGWGHKFAVDGENGPMVYLMPRSIKSGSISDEQFNELAERVYKLLRDEFGLDHEVLLQEMHEDA